MANSVDPDQTPHSVPSELGLNFLHRAAILRIYTNDAQSGHVNTKYWTTELLNMLFLKWLYVRVDISKNMLN